MSGRQARKLMKQRDNDLLEKEFDLEDDGEYEKEKEKVLNPFQVLGDNESFDDDDQDEQESIQVKVIPKVLKKKKKKSKKKQDQPKEEDDIDKVIQEVEQQFGRVAALENSAETKNQPDNKSTALFAVSLKALDWEREMLVNFGSGAVAAAESKVKTKNRTGLKKRILVSPKNTWPRVPPQGISMIQTEPNFFTLQHSPAYQEFEFMFYQCIETHNPDTLYEILRECPYQINSLLQLSETFKQNGDVSMATDFVERALYAFECSFHPHFNLSLGICRLDYGAVESRPIFVCIFRHIQYLSRKGCWKTALEFTKLLFSLDPITDPLAAVLLIDFYAVKSESYQWYIEYWDEFKDRKGLDQLPNAVYSAALSKYELESKKGKKADYSEANKMLEEAILQFPTVVQNCLLKMGLVDSAISNNPFFTYPKFENSKMNHETVLLLIDMYVESSFSNWKVPELLAWLKDISKSVLTRKLSPPTIESSPPFPDSDSLALNIQRMVVLSDETTFISRLPAGAMEDLMLFDPMPPPDSKPSVYDKIRNVSSPDRSISGGLNGFMNFLLGGFRREEADE